MDLILSIFLWIAGVLGFVLLFMTIVFASIAEARSESSKRDQSMVVSIASVLLIVLIGMAGLSLFSDTGVDVVAVASEQTQANSTSSQTTSASISDKRGAQAIAPHSSTEKKTVKSSQKNETLIWIFYTIFFGSFFIWLFTPSKKDKATKDAIREKMLNNLMMDKMKNSSKD